MKFYEAEQLLKNELKKIYEEQEAINITSIAIEYITSYSKAGRLTKNEEELSDAQAVQLNQCLQQLLTHKPIQYIMNKAWFYGMELYVDKNVLIPRPETEELVEWIINDVKQSGKNFFERKTNEADETTQLKIIDVGTGSGCIALALKKTMPLAEVWGCDISDEALTVARRNGSILDIRVDFQGLNFLDEAQHKQLPTVDIIVSNPPYIAQANKQKMDKNVVDHEPHIALFVADNDVLIFYKALAKFGKKRLYSNGNIYMEINEGLGKDVIKLFEDEGYKNVELKKDMQGKDRVIKAHPGLPGGKENHTQQRLI